MAFVEDVRSLADCFSELSSAEIVAIEQQGLRVEDVRRQLSRHLVDQFWCCVLRRSPHCSPPEHGCRKNSRYSVSRILEDLELSARKKVNRNVHSLSTFDSVQPCTTSVYPQKNDSSKTKYQRRDIYVDVALQLHRQVMRRKGLELELLALDMLLQLYTSISHINTRSNHLTTSSSTQWYRFTSGDEVLEMLCHLSSEPETCMAFLELGRHILVRKGIRQIRDIDTKVLLGFLNDSGSTSTSLSKWIPGHHAPAVSQQSTVHHSERWTSIAFDKALSKIDNIDSGTSVSECAAMGLQSLTLSPPITAHPTKPSIHPGWLSISSEQMLNPVDTDSIGKLSISNTGDISGTPLDTNVANKWIISSLRPSYVEPDSDAFGITDTKTSKPCGCDMSAGNTEFHSLKWMKERMNQRMSQSSLFCHIDPGSRALLQHFGSWQCLPSFDTAFLSGNLRHSGSDILSQDSIMESMVDCTVLDLYKFLSPGTTVDSKLKLDWFPLVLLCLQGIESILFACEAWCLYSKDPLSVADRVHRWVKDGSELNQRSLKVICKNYFDNTMAVQMVEDCGIIPLRLSPDGKYVEFNYTLVPLKDNDLSLLINLTPTAYLEGLPEYKSLKTLFQEVAHIGTIIRKLKYSIELFRHLEAQEAYRFRIGTSLSVYISSVGSFVDEFEASITNLAATDFRGDLSETLSVFSLFMDRLHPWLNALYWFEDLDRGFNRRTESEIHISWPRGAHLLDHLIATYLGKFGLVTANNCLGHSYGYKCLTTVFKPYLSFLRAWVTGCSTDECAAAEFQKDGKLCVILPLVPLEDTIASSREMSLFLKCHYPSHLPTLNSVFPNLLSNLDLSTGSIFDDIETNGANLPPLQELIRGISDGLYANNLWLNQKLLWLLKSDHNLLYVLEDLYRYVLLSRIDLMDAMFVDWSQGRTSALYPKLFRKPLNVQATVDSVTGFRIDGVKLTISSGVFDNHLFTEEIIKCYSDVFNQLCTVHIGARNVLEVSKWLCMNYRGRSALGTQGCAPILRMVCLLSCEMYAFFSIVEWFFHCVSLGPMYSALVSRIRTSSSFTEVINLHTEFAHSMRHACLASPDSRHCNIILRNLFYCAKLLKDTLLGGVMTFGHNIEHVEYWLSLESSLNEIKSKFANNKREFLFVVNSSHDTHQFQLATILESAIHHSLIF
ncbi:gamma tubulin complex component 3, putative [Babesia ovis]|uniref:Gamma tubulin complex component 3, putative n=1 Tax=Babesia ovis TaxID=5869 RepID=A0A9W5WVR5_BABOV|nr:gamma tubulin complex component 3, putative [Babesia ovis]